MARNNASGPGARHVNFRYHFCRELHGTLIELIFVKSEENEADILTKNVRQDEFTRHANKWVSPVPNLVQQYEDSVKSGSLNKN